MAPGSQKQIEKSPRSDSSTSTLSLNSQYRKKLVESLKQLARGLSKERFFWEVWVDRLLSGDIPYLEPIDTLRDFKPIDEIAKDVHKLTTSTSPYEELTAEEKLFLVNVINVVKRGLDIRSR